MTKGSSSIKVAVIDQGVAGHEDLGDRLLPGFTPGLANGNGAPVSNNPHGECCAGIIGASHNNLGIAGIAPLVKIVPVNIFYSQSSSNIAAAINYAWDDAEADVISNSWGDRCTATYSEHRSMYSYVRLSIDRCTATYSEHRSMYSSYV